MRNRKRTRTRSQSSRESTPAPVVQQEQPRLKLNKKVKFDRCFDTATKSMEEVLGMHLSQTKLLYFLPRLSEKQKKSWTSTVYNHYWSPEILVVDNVVKYVFVCKRYTYPLPPT